MKRITVIPTRPLVHMCDQWCFLHSSSEETSTSRNKPNMASRQEFIVNSEHPITISSTFSPSSSAPLPLVLNCALTQVSVKLRLGDYFNDITISTIVRLEVEYLPPEEVVRVFSVPMDVTTLPYSDHVDTQPIYLTKLHFYIIPLYYKYNLKPKRVTFTKRALSMLLETTEENIEFALSTNTKEINKICRTVATSLRLEYTTAGARVFINGVDDTTAYKVVSDPDSFYRSTFMLRFYLRQYVSLRRERLTAANARYYLAWDSAKTIQRFFLVCFAKQKVLLIRLRDLLSGISGRNKADRLVLERVSELVYTKLNLKMNLRASFRGVEVIIYGKFFRYRNEWNLFLHIEEVLDATEAADATRLLPLNVQTVVDDGYLRHVVGNIEKLNKSSSGADYNEIMKMQEARVEIFNTVPNFIDVMLSKQKTRMAVRLIKYIVF